MTLLAEIFESSAAKQQTPIYVTCISKLVCVLLEYISNVQAIYILFLMSTPIFSDATIPILPSVSILFWQHQTKAKYTTTTNTFNDII